MSKDSRPLSKSVWSKIDVKSWAITEFTLRQYQTRKSTWSIAIIGMLLVTLVLLFYIKGQTSIIESIDQDGDSYDWDCLLYTSPSPRDRTRSRMPSSA